MNYIIKKLLAKKYFYLQVGLMGLIEREWLATLSTLTEAEVEWEDFVPAARRLSAAFVVYATSGST